jgi:type III pantothenate kinase
MAKHLVLDFGNTLKKLALFDAGRLVVVESRTAVSRQSVDGFLREHPGITASILSSVVRHSPGIAEYLRQHTHYIVLDSRTPVPLVNSYRTKGTLGKDRLASAVYGATAFPGENVLIINAGTALTFDFVDAKGVYHGGSISPGMQMRFRALHTFTDRLPLVSCAGLVEQVGADTRMSILSGVVNGMVAEIEGVSEGYRARFPELKVVLSGGDLDYFVKRLKISIFARPNVVIHGLQQILAFNVPESP